MKFWNVVFTDFMADPWLTVSLILLLIQNHLGELFDADLQEGIQLLNWELCTEINLLQELSPLVSYTVGTKIQNKWRMPEGMTEY